MRDMQAQLEKLRAQVAECELIRDLATVAKHHKMLVAEIERAIAESKK